MKGRRVVTNSHLVCHLHVPRFQFHGISNAWAVLFDPISAKNDPLSTSLAIRSECSKVELTALKSSARQELARDRQVATPFGIRNCLARQAELPSVVMGNARVKAGDRVRCWLSNLRVGGVYTA